jgi:excisionase family DNA binding protein
MTETELSDWLPIADAAHVIGCSTRTVERLARARKLEQRLRPQAGSPAVAVYNPDDVHRIASERHPAPPPFVLPASATGNGNGNGRDSRMANDGRSSSGSIEALARPPVGDPIHQFFALMLQAIQSPPLPPVSVTVAPTSFVTIREASALTGLSQAYLRRAIEGQTLPAIRDRGWRIRRRDLEAL